jgi:hypothetical protein
MGGERDGSRKVGYPGVVLCKGLQDSRVSLAKGESSYPRADVVEGCVGELAGATAGQLVGRLQRC